MSAVAETTDVDVVFEQAWESSSRLEYQNCSLKELAKFWFWRGRLAGLEAGARIAGLLIDENGETKK